MPAQVTNYKCPACTGPLHFVGSSGKLECEYCGSVYEVAEIEAMVAQSEASAQAAFAAAEQSAQMSANSGWDVSQTGSDWGSDAAGMKAYNCPSCGAELICDETTAATSCPYCGNPTVVPGQFGGALKPDYIIPFKLDKNAAIQALKAHYKGKRFLPKSFTDQNHIDEIKGVYVPFWLFDGVANVDAMFEATRSTTTSTRKEQITNTDHFAVHRAGRVAFEKVPVDASSKMPDAHMDSIEPYDFSELKEFSTAYLPGFLADKYDVSVDDCAVRADERCKNSAVQAMADTVIGYETCVQTAAQVDLERGKVKYAFIPVWLLSTRWNDQNFLFAMNGQTGKLIGDLPMSKKKFWTTFGVIAGAITAVLSLILFL